MGYNSNYRFRYEIPSPNFEDSEGMDLLKNGVLQVLLTLRDQDLIEDVGYETAREMLFDRMRDTMNLHPWAFIPYKPITEETLDSALRRLSGYSNISFCDGLSDATFYEWKNVFQKLSWEFPAVTFIVERDGEEKGDQERGRFRDGQAQYVRARTCWPDWGFDGDDEGFEEPEELY